ncbi:hypothetical protein F4821DRAFT_236237 [Hypoxylon rubiginosum]|uniref:Uncharacterized protein n=1 Tax=Hypoxylon rubiginosum TaxID=110542 RepID=A0ACC0D3M6_9PEZI|nr:hypothetical protein F4821DRAFT_236237 [Hypoxylon rubiginosum]
MSSRGREYDRRSSTRPRSKSGAFLDALGSGNVRDAIGALKPGSDPNSGDRHHRRSRGDDDYYYDERPRHRHSRYDDYPSGEDDYYYEETRPRRRHRSTHTSDHHHGRDGRGRDRPSRRSISTGPNFKQAAEAAVAAGVVEAWRSRRDGDRTARVATAAIGAAATDALLNRDGDRKGKKHVLESVIAGLAENRVVNGSRR